LSQDSLLARLSDYCIFSITYSIMSKRREW